MHACIAFEAHPQYDNDEGIGAIENAKAQRLRSQPLATKAVQQSSKNYKDRGADDQPKHAGSPWIFASTEEKVQKECPGGLCVELVVDRTSAAAGIYKNVFSSLQIKYSQKNMTRADFESALLLPS